MFTIDTDYRKTLKQQLLTGVNGTISQNYKNEIKNTIQSSIVPELQPKMYFKLMESYQDKSFSMLCPKFQSWLFPSTWGNQNKFIKFDKDSVVIQALPIVKLFPTFPINKINWEDEFECEWTDALDNNTRLKAWQNINKFELITVYVFNCNLIQRSKCYDIQMSYEYQNRMTNTKIRIRPFVDSRRYRYFNQPHIRQFHIYQSLIKLKNENYQAYHCIDDFPSNIKVHNKTMIYEWRRFDELERRNQKPSIIVLKKFNSGFVVNYNSFSQNKFSENGKPNTIIGSLNENDNQVILLFHPPFTGYFQQHYVPNGIPNFIRYKQNKQCKSNRRYFICKLGSTRFYFTNLFDTLLTLCMNFRFLNKDVVCYILHFAFPECTFSLIQLFYSLANESVVKILEQKKIVTF
jgi:hypothetical protein